RLSSPDETDMIRTLPEKMQSRTVTSREVPVIDSPSTRRYATSVRFEDLDLNSATFRSLQRAKGLGVNRTSQDAKQKLKEHTRRRPVSRLVSSHRIDRPGGHFKRRFST